MEKRRVTVKGIQIARIDEDLCKEYEEFRNEPISMAAKRFMENLFMPGFEVKGKDEIEKVKGRIKLFRFNSIGDWLATELRNDLKNKGFEHCCEECMLFRCGEDELKYTGDPDIGFCPMQNCFLSRRKNDNIANCFVASKKPAGKPD